MIQIAGGFQFHDLYIYPDLEVNASPNRFFYFPVTPQPETDAQGRPTLLSIPSNQGGFLQLGAHLEAGNVERERLEAVRNELLVRLNQSPSTVETVGAASAALIDRTIGTADLALEPAPLHVIEARLQLGNGDESMLAAEDLAHNETSGFYPYTTLFSVPVSPEQQSRVTATLNGRPGFLMVRYDASLPLPVQASAQLLGDIHGIIADLVTTLGVKPRVTPEVIDPVDSSGADLFNLAVVLLEKAIEQGQVKVKTQSSESVPEHLLQRAINEARQRMLDLLVSEARRQTQTPPIQTLSLGLDLAHAETSASFIDSVNYPLSLVTDVATWFGGQAKGTDHLMLLPGK